MILLTKPRILDSHSNFPPNDPRWNALFDKTRVSLITGAALPRHAKASKVREQQTKHFMRVDYCSCFRVSWPVRYSTAAINSLTRHVSSVLSSRDLAAAATH